MIDYFIYGTLIYLGMGVSIYILILILYRLSLIENDEELKDGNIDESQHQYFIINSHCILDIGFGIYTSLFWLPAFSYAFYRRWFPKE